MKSTSSMFAFALLLNLAFSAFAVAQYAANQAERANYQVLYRFLGGTDGACPYGVLVRDAAGNLYGTTYQGGINNNGTVFELDATGKKTLLHSFTGGPDRGSSFSDGANTYSGLVLDSAGTLYGTTAYGGSFNLFCSVGCGTIFSLTQTPNGWQESVLYRFQGVPDAAFPGGLTRDSAGNFFGTAEYPLYGTAFEFETGGKETVLYTFRGPPDGSVPSDLIVDAKGNLYGTTYEGGNRGCQDGEGCGTVFELDQSGSETVLYTFSGGADGRYPSGTLLRGRTGNLYGTTSSGGGSSNCSGGCGTVFKLDNTSNETVLYSFTGTPDGSQPSGALVADSAGNIYGTTFAGGAYGAGTVFKLDSTGKEMVLHRFLAGVDGNEPHAGLIRDATGTLYGTTCFGGGPGRGSGIVFKVTP
jgi:uncharacterized repeat protein (TIGR03803 family)